MKTASLVLVLLVASVAFGQFGQSRPDKGQPATRSLTGFVTDKSGTPIPQAMIYLKNTKTASVKTFIAEQDGSYRFHQLSPNIDYEIHAESNGRQSETKTLSSFDSRAQARINLRIDR